MSKQETKEASGQLNSFLQLTLNNLSEVQIKNPIRMKSLPEPASSNETPEQLNDRLQHALQSMSAGASKVTIIKTSKQPQLRIDCEFNDMSDIRTKETPEQRKARLKRAGNYLRAIRTRETSAKRRSRKERVRKQMAIVRRNETTEERDARLASALKHMTEVKLYKQKRLKSRPKVLCPECRISEVNTNNEPDNNDRMEQTTPQTTAEITPEASKSENNEFETLLSYFLKQEHKPPNLKKKTVDKEEDKEKREGMSDTVRENALDIKYENAYNDVNVDLEEPFRKIVAEFNEHALGNSSRSLDKEEDKGKREGMIDAVRENSLDIKYENAYDDVDVDLEEPFRKIVAEFNEHAFGNSSRSVDKEEDKEKREGMSDTVRENALDIKYENAYDDVDVDLEEPFQKIVAEFNEHAFGNSSRFEKTNELHKREPDSINATGIKTVNETDLDDSLLRRSIDETKTLHNFDNTVLSNIEIHQDMETTYNENMDTVKKEGD